MIYSLSAVPLARKRCVLKLYGYETPVQAGVEPISHSGPAVAAGSGQNVIEAKNLTYSILSKHQP